MKLGKIIAIFFGVVIIGLLGILLFLPSAKSPVSAPAAPVIVSADGRLQLDLPHANDWVSSPVAIQGTVTGGGWFFEASFPIKVLDDKGRVIGSGTAQALSDWTSTGTVPFSASIVFVVPDGDMTGTILLSKSNPSGLLANAESLSVPVQF